MTIIPKKKSRMKGKSLLGGPTDDGQPNYFHKNVVYEFNRAYQAISDAKNISVPAPVIRPVFREIPIDNKFKAAGERFDMCPYEIEEILDFAVGSDNELVNAAFKKFLLTAKIALDIPLDNLRDSIRQHRENYETKLANWKKQDEARSQKLAEKDEAIVRAIDKISRQWQEFLNGLSLKLKEDNRIETLGVWDRSLLQSIRIEEKESVSVVAGKVYLDLDILRSINYESVKKIFQEAINLKKEEDRRRVIESIVKSNEDDLLAELYQNDSLDIDTQNQIMYMLLTKQGRRVCIDRDGRYYDGGPTGYDLDVDPDGNFYFK